MRESRCSVFGLLSLMMMQDTSGYGEGVKGSQNTDRRVKKKLQY